MRVTVRNGDRSKYLGEGTYNDSAVVFVVVQPDGSLRSMPDASQYPSRDLEATGQVVRHERNPVIVLDSGQTVFGCQVWWSPIPEGPATYTHEEPDMVKMLGLAALSAQKYAEN